MSTYPRFETEARGNSEMANCKSMQFYSYPEKPAHISRLHHWFPGEMRNERRNSILMCLTTHWLDPLIAIVPQEKIVLTVQKIRVVTRHKYGVSSRVTLRSFRGEASGDVAKRRLFSQATSAKGDSRSRLPAATRSTQCHNVQARSLPVGGVGFLHQPQD